MRYKNRTIAPILVTQICRKCASISKMFFCFHVHFYVCLVNFPAFSHDAWEIKRRNLVIHDDKKLGQGAFGAVFLGRLIGAANGGKEAQSTTLGVNFARAENCAVAVKMLPRKFFYWLLAKYLAHIWSGVFCFLIYWNICLQNTPMICANRNFYAKLHL